MRPTLCMNFFSDIFPCMNFFSDIFPCMIFVLVFFPPPSPHHFSNGQSLNAILTGILSRQMATDKYIGDLSSALNFSCVLSHPNATCREGRLGTRQQLRDDICSYTHSHAKSRNQFPFADQNLRPRVKRLQSLKIVC